MKPTREVCSDLHGNPIQSDHVRLAGLLSSPVCTCESWYLETLSTRDGKRSEVKAWRRSTDVNEAVRLRRMDSTAFVREGEVDCFVRERRCKTRRCSGSDVAEVCMLEQQLNGDHEETIQVACSGRANWEADVDVEYNRWSNKRNPDDSLLLLAVALTPAKDAVQR